MSSWSPRREYYLINILAYLLTDTSPFDNDWYRVWLCIVLKMHQTMTLSLTAVYRGGLDRGRLNYLVIISDAMSWHSPHHTHTHTHNFLWCITNWQMYHAKPLYIILSNNHEQLETSLEEPSGFSTNTASWVFKLLRSLTCSSSPIKGLQLHAHYSPETCSKEAQVYDNLQ